MNGYILESKSILDSDIWKMPPLYFKVWHYLLLNAAFADVGNLKRGQLFTTTQEIAEACSYYKGFQKITPTKHEIWNVIEWLRSTHEGNHEWDTKGTMIVTTKVTHGMLVTICNYNVYQDPKSYERNNERNHGQTTNVTTVGFDGNNIKNEENKERKRLIKEYIDERKARSIS